MTHKTFHVDNVTVLVSDVEDPAEVEEELFEPSTDLQLPPNIIAVSSFETNVEW